MRPAAILDRVQLSGASSLIARAVWKCPIPQVMTASRGGWFTGALTEGDGRDGETLFDTDMHGVECLAQEIGNCVVPHSHLHNHVLSARTCVQMEHSEDAIRQPRGNEKSMKERTIRCTENGAKCVLRRVALERNTNIDEGNVKLIKNREGPDFMSGNK